MKKFVLKNGLIVLSFISLITLLSCEKEPGSYVVNTLDVDQVTLVSARGGGEIISKGGTEITECGVCWSTMGTPSISDKKSVSEIRTGKYNVKITDLDHDKLYYIRAYITNEYGTFYGETKSFVPDYYL